MRKLSLFSGIGGIDLAAHWAGMETVAFCEREPFPVKVLKKNFPGVPIYDDVCTLTADRLKEDGIIGDGRAIDIISAGFPCQPFSHAGQRGGTDDERYLWPEVVRVVADIRPTWFVGENVAGLLSMAEPTGGTEVESRIVAREADEDFYEAVYTQQEIMLIGRICQDLKDIGYEVQVYVLPAASVGSAHKRDRTFIVAHTESGRRTAWGAEQQRQQGELCSFGCCASCTSESMAYSESNTQGRLSIRTGTENPGLAGCSKDVANTTCERCGETRGDQCGRSEKRTSGCSTDVAYSNHQRQQECDSTTGSSGMGHLTGCADEIGVHCAAGATQPGMGGSTDELPAGLDGCGIDSLDELINLIHEYPQPALMGMPQYDWEPPRVATGVKDRTGRLKALGNAVNPLQIYPFMAAIKAINDQL